MERGHGQGAVPCSAGLCRAMSPQPTSPLLAHRSKNCITNWGAPAIATGNPAQDEIGHGQGLGLAEMVIFHRGIFPLQAQKYKWLLFTPQFAPKSPPGCMLAARTCSCGWADVEGDPSTPLQSPAHPGVSPHPEPGSRSPWKSQVGLFGLSIYK